MSLKRDRPPTTCPACGAPWTSTPTPVPGSLECHHQPGCAAITAEGNQR